MFPPSTSLNTSHSRINSSHTDIHTNSHTHRANCNTPSGICPAGLQPSWFMFSPRTFCSISHSRVKSLHTDIHTNTHTNRGKYNTWSGICLAGVEDYLIDVFPTRTSWSVSKGWSCLCVCLSKSFWWTPQVSLRTRSSKSEATPSMKSVSGS